MGAESCTAAEALAAEVEDRLALPLRSAPPGNEKALAEICEGTDYRPPSDPRCHGIATDRYCRAIATSGSLYPDHVVFLGRGLPVLEQRESLNAMISAVKADGLRLPVAFLVPGIGSVIHKNASNGAEAMLTCLALVTSRLPLNAEITYLTAENEQALLNWDAERYRQQLTAQR